jgi:2-phospho-L-lactate guanylyltransferase
LPEGVVLIEQSRSGLNTLLEQGREWGEDAGADALLVIFADLPLLLVEEIEEMLALGRGENTIVLAPDRHRTGTNAMLAHPASLARFAFGENSLARHRALAEEAGATVVEYFSEGTSFDVDTPDDLALVKSKRLRAGERVA